MQATISPTILESCPAGSTLHRFLSLLEYPCLSYLFLPSRTCLFSSCVSLHKKRNHCHIFPYLAESVIKELNSKETCRPNMEELIDITTFTEMKNP